MRRTWVGLWIAALALTGSSLAGTRAGAQMSADRSTVAIATATQLGNYFLTGNAICRALQRQGHYLDSGDVTSVNCAAVASAGSIQNVDLLRGRVVNVALIQSDWHHHAYMGVERFAGRRTDQLRSLLSFNQEAFQLFAGRGSNITAWTDLKAKKVNIGPAGSTAGTMFQELFRVHGNDESWLTQAFRLPSTAHVQEMCEGNIEALGQTSGVPNSGLADAARRCGARIVPLDTPQITKMVDDLSYYIPVTVPAGTYAGQMTDVTTFGVVATLVATSEMSTSLAYSIVRAVFEGLDDMKAAVPVLRNVVVETMVRDGLTAPLHPGASKYFRERGWLPVGRPTASNRPATKLAEAETAGAPVETVQAAAAALEAQVSAGTRGAKTAGRGKRAAGAR